MSSKENEKANPPKSQHTPVPAPKPIVKKSNFSDQTNSRGGKKPSN